MTSEKIVSYILVNRTGGAVTYWGYGQKAKWVQDLEGARRYAKESSANSGRSRVLAVRPELDATCVKVEAIEE